MKSEFSSKFNLKTAITPIMIAVFGVIIVFSWLMAATIDKDQHIMHQGQVLLDKNSINYNGSYRGDDTFDGQGDLKYQNGDEYVGGFKDGQFDGSGTFTSHNGWKFEGTFKKGVAVDKGVLTSSNGEVINVIVNGDKFEREDKK
ncbi:MAG: hypothetical protein LBM27_06220 [Lactobacillaceae bacterium]|jgi:hypothetical protein|nr:hypothetical protein [Lactobacillaceae bacterium]